MTYEEFYRETCYRQFKRGLPLILALMVASFLAIPFTPQSWRIMAVLYSINGIAMSLVTLIALSVIRTFRSLTVGCALILGSVYLADDLVFEDITCSFLNIPLSPVYVVGYITLILLAMHQRSNPNATVGQRGVLILSFVFALASSGMEFVDLLSLSFTAPLWIMVMSKIFLAMLPILLVSTVHSVAIEGFQNQLAETQRANEKLMFSMRYIICGEIFGALVHDFRNITGEVYWAVQRLKRVASQKETTPALDGAIQALDHSANVSEQFIQYLKMDPAAVGEVDVQSVLKSVLTFAKNSGKLSRNIRFVTEFCEGTSAHVTASEYRLFSVFLNIVVNALQSLAESNQQDKIIKASIRTDPATVSIKITDNGPGIDEEILPKIFTVFSTKPQGGGLGLYLVWEYVTEELRGTIKVKSKPYHETSFCVILNTGVVVMGTKTKEGQIT